MKSYSATLLSFALAAALATGTAWSAAGYIERTSIRDVGRVLATEGAHWAKVQADGLQLILTGTAPSEAARLRAVARAGRVVDPARVIDAMEVAARAPLGPPRYSLEILRNEGGISLIGLVPTEGGREALERGLRRFDEVTDMVDTADRAVPADWDPAVAFAMEALEDLPQAKISVVAGEVRITAIADSDAERRRLETQLSRAAPDEVSLKLDIAAPRPVITPFTLRFVHDGQTGRFDACAVDSAEAKGRVLAAATAAGFEGKADCTIALGVPSASWGQAAALAIGAVADLGGGSVTLSDADVTFVAAEGADPLLFERRAAELESDLPDIFSLTAINPDPVVIDGTGDGGNTPEFVATRSPEGQVQLRGRLRDEMQVAAVGSYGRALFGSGDTYVATRTDPDLPQGWPTRVLAGLDALSRLEAGAVVVQPDVVDLRGRTGNRNAEADLSRLLSEKLGEGANYRIDVEYMEELDPLLSIPTPEECLARLNAAQDGGKLSFAPGEAVIEETSAGLLGDLVAILRECERVAVEVAGHTDSQGREVMNQELSQARADAVRLALIERGVAPGQLVAVGYGETQPIADNDTEEGREANRRIAFTLLGRRSRSEIDADAELIEAQQEAAVADAAELGEDGAGETEGDAPSEEGAEAPAEEGQ
ncbi:OmpA family protein [Jannaschia aquimarina]|uniref:OprF_1 protein n=1 Tax=Jannaschia aquimarina TaxID=935700 RepID=A0A0D1EHE0_9RHOB|nr:OmpA family protein [Jannaschia aquimarina]KIT17094.1 Outer membrane porin F precursor [Jannaschia aquimarina]SNS46663.1 OmpA-OmpF porin, OOP family [Jannaschia aquimarina]